VRGHGPLTPARVVKDDSKASSRWTAVNTLASDGLELKHNPDLLVYSRGAGAAEIEKTI